MADKKAKKSKTVTSVRLGDEKGPLIPAPYPLPVEMLIAMKHLLTPEEIRQAVERGDAAREEAIAAKKERDKNK
jgi:hypothetical protein